MGEISDFLSVGWLIGEEEKEVIQAAISGLQEEVPGRGSDWGKVQTPGAFVFKLEKLPNYV